MGLRFRVLGPLGIDGAEGIELTRPSHRRLLSILLLAHGRRVATDAAIARFWPEDPPERAKAALQTHLSDLRRQLPDGRIVTEGYGYRLELGEHLLDADAFDRQLATAQQLRRDRAWDELLDAVEVATSLWRGTPYAELRDDSFARPEIARLEERHLELLGLRMEALLATGREHEAAAALEGLVAEHPLHERLSAQLMLARYRLGRQAEALETYHQIRADLTELGLEPGAELQRLQRRILRHDPELTGRPANNLPVELTSFVGRERELEELDRRLQTHRIVTVTGVGGSGKTRLAQRLAAARLDRHPDGVWVVELAALREAEQVDSAVATAIGLKPGADDATAALRSALRDADLLIVLDNCEHLGPAPATVVRRLVEAGPHVRVIATSRTPLGAPGELVFDVPPMAVPADPVDDSELRDCDAVRLFEERANAAWAGYESADAVTVAEICRRLDGVPLAIELAAARVRALGVDELLALLEDRFTVLADDTPRRPARHRTLDATIAWSYDLLEPVEQTLFARLSVFRGSFELAAVEHVCGFGRIAPRDVAALVAGLVDHSLVSVVESSTGRRYRLLETVRAFARERLEEAGDTAEVRERHRAWCVEVADGLRRTRYGALDASVTDRLDEVADDLHAALDRALADEVPSDVQVETLAAVLGWHLLQRGHVGQAGSRLELALGLCTEPASQVQLRAQLARARFESGDVQEAAEQAHLAADVAADLPPSWAKVMALTNHARLLMLLVDHDPRGAVAVAQAAAVAADELGETLTRAHATSTLAHAMAWTGDVDGGLHRQRSALELAMSAGDPDSTIATFGGSLDLLFQHPIRRRDGPRQLAEELLTWLEEEGIEFSRNAKVCNLLGYVFLQSGEWDRAEDVIERAGRVHLEGYDQTWNLMTFATLRWMQGRLRDADAALATLERLGVNPRWYHDYLPLRAEVAADAGRLDDVLAAADRYLDVAVDPSEESKKVGVLVVVVRARVDAALDATDETRADHLRRIDEAIERMRSILERFPPPSEGSLQLETHTTHLAFAEAERSRLLGPDPELWRDAVRRSDYAYSRLYAARRLAEALAYRGDDEAAAAEVRARYQDACRLGAERIRDELRTLADRIGVPLPAEPSLLSRSKVLQ